ncbi:MAG: NfeD family protein [Gemmatimonadota bacterium]|nr:MAG: NfeD family protein [Gemmatimonadota bacterium]
MDLFFGGNAVWFTVPAFLGSFFFILRLALMLVGGHGDMHADVHGDVHVDFQGDLHGDVHGDSHLGDHGDSSSAFKLLSIQSIAAFMMGFGWGGLGGFKGAGWSATTSTLFGLAVGVGMVWLLGKLLEGVYRLQSSGTMSINSALGVEGSVYITVPPHRSGRGRVRLVIDDRERFYNAVTDSDAIESHARVRITEVNDDNTVTVTRV